ncbi:hypothetical protein Dimus_032891 [Dionaea muscipula]
MAASMVASMVAVQGFDDGNLGDGGFNGDSNNGCPGDGGFNDGWVLVLVGHDSWGAGAIGGGVLVASTAAWLVEWRRPYSPMLMLGFQWEDIDMPRAVLGHAYGLSLSGEGERLGLRLVSPDFSAHYDLSLANELILIELGLHEVLHAPQALELGDMLGSVPKPSVRVQASHEAELGPASSWLSAVHLRGRR